MSGMKTYLASFLTILLVMANYFSGLVPEEKQTTYGMILLSIALPLIATFLRLAIAKMETNGNSFTTVRSLLPVLALWLLGSASVHAQTPPTGLTNKQIVSAVVRVGGPDPNGNFIGATGWVSAIDSQGKAIVLTNRHVAAAFGQEPTIMVAGKAVKGKLIGCDKNGSDLAGIEGG